MPGSLAFAAGLFVGFVAGVAALACYLWRQVSVSDAVARPC